MATISTANKSKPKKLSGKLLIGLIVVLLVTSAALIYSVRSPMSRQENELVGRWKNAEGAALGGVVFTSNRGFHSTDGEFVGHWWIDANGLQIQYWRANDANSWLTGTVQQWQRRYDAPIDTWTIAIDDNGKQLTMTAPDSEVTLQRVEAAPSLP